MELIEQALKAYAFGFFIVGPIAVAAFALYLWAKIKVRNYLFERKARANPFWNNSWGGK